MKWTMAVGGVVLGFLMGCGGNGQNAKTPPADQKAAVAAIHKIGGSVIYQEGDPVEVSFRQNDRLSEAVLKELSKLDRIQKLDLVRTNVADADLAQLKGLTSLRTLWLSNTSITDDGLVFLKGLENLDWLDLHGTDVTDAGLVHLEGLANLTKLELQKTKVTAEGMARLKKALPKLENIVH